MESTKQFLERLRARLGGASECSDYRLAKVLEVSHVTIHGYLKKGRSMDDKVALNLAKQLNIEPAYVVACCHAERSTSAESLKLWTEIAARFAA